MSNTTTSSRTEILAQIWQRLLQVPLVGPNDNFFDLGGDSALAIQLFSEIAEAFGQKLPPVMIYQVPTINSLAALMQNRTARELTALIQVRKGSEKPPVFIASGLGGGLAEFVRLAKYMRATNPIYGLQPKGIEGFDQPCERIEEMADFYLDAIRRFHAHERYILVGYSLGGLVTLEMARRLTANGENVAMLIMVDSYPDIRTLPPVQFLRLLSRRMKRRLAKVAKLGRVDNRLAGVPSRDVISTFAPGFEPVRDAAYRALRQYKPTFYPGSAKFIRAAEVTDFPGNPRRVWSHLIQTLEVETMPGDHLGIMNTHYQKLANMLDDYLATANSE